MERVAQVRPLLCSMLDYIYIIMLNPYHSPKAYAPAPTPYLCLLYIHAGEEEKAAQRAIASAVVKGAIDRAVVRVSQEGSSDGESGAGETITL